MAGRGDRTEKPTPKRLREARREGNIARSPDVAAWAGVLAATVLIQLTARRGASALRDLLEESARVAARPDPGAALGLLGEGLRSAVGVTAPLVLGMMAVGVVGSLAQTGLVLTPVALKPKFSHVNPLAGFKKMLSPATAWEAAKSTVKVAVLAWFVVRAVSGTIPRLVDSGRLSADAVVALVGSQALALARSVAVAGLVLAALDYAYQRRRISRSVSMSKQEVKEEHRQAEGDPQMRGAIRSRQMAMSRNRMMAEVGGADVVVVNPVHVAVALTYDPAHGAPRVVARGAGAVAARIRAEAERSRVPIVENIPLARTIYHTCELGHYVPPELYEAVARLLAFVFGLKARGVASGVHRLPATA